MTVLFKIHSIINPVFQRFGTVIIIEFYGINIPVENAPFHSAAFIGFGSLNQLFKEKLADS